MSLSRNAGTLFEFGDRRHYRLGPVVMPISGVYGGESSGLIAAHPELKSSQFSHSLILRFIYKFADPDFEPFKLIITEWRQVALVDFVVFWIEEHVLPANLVNLLARPTKEVQMHLRAPRLIEPPIPEVFIIH